MSTPRVKRPFAGAASDPSQRQITSFFTPASSADTYAPEAIRSPPLPASVESNLLSVGMRIRKSVPEGYKVGNHSAFKLWTDNTPLPTASRPNVPSSTPSRSVSRELMPFCGINSVGGLSSQPAALRNDPEDDDIPSIEDIPELTMSQESNDSTDSTSSNVKKRFFTAEDDEVLDSVQTFMADSDGGVSPRTLTTGGGYGNARVMAVPRSRAVKATGVVPAGQVGGDQENMAMDGDFEDAAFLVYGEGRDVDMAA